MVQATACRAVIYGFNSHPQLQRISKKTESFEGNVSNRFGCNSDLPVNKYRGFDLNLKVQLKKQILLYDIFRLNIGKRLNVYLTLFCNKQRQKSSSAYISYGEGFVSKSRFFDSPNCGSCIYKGSSYCWGQCSLNIWKRDKFY
jgi:hypothetical protein